MEDSSAFLLLYLIGTQIERLPSRRMMGAEGKVLYIVWVKHTKVVAIYHRKEKTISLARLKAWAAKNSSSAASPYG